MANEKHGFGRSAIARVGLAASGLAVTAASANPPQPPLAETISQAAHAQIASPLSPIFGAPSSLPPMLLMTSTRDLLLSQTVLAHLAPLKAGVKADLRVYEGMPHAFWALPDTPETDEALAARAQFLKTHLK